MGDPISAIASPIVDMVIQSVAASIHEEYLALARLEEDVENLAKTLRDIKQVLETVEKGPQEPKVTDLLESLKDAAHDAEDVLDMVSTEALWWTEKQQQVRFCPTAAGNWVVRLKNRSVPKKIDKIRKKINSIKERFLDMKKLLNPFEEIPTIGQWKEGNRTTDPVQQSQVVGREVEKRKLIEMLESERYNVEGAGVFLTPITGMGGIGKTTLAQEVFNECEDFSKKIWISVSNRNRDWKINHDKILEATKTACAKDLSQASLEEVVRKAVEDLKLLIVLDDVWSEDLKDWQNLEKVLLKAHKGTRVIVTSRLLHVFGFSTENVPIPNTELQQLPHEECLKIFARNAIEGDVSSLESKGVKEIADKFVQKCDGLPLAVEVIGNLLRTKPLQEWPDIYKLDLAKFEEDESRVRNCRQTLPILRVSYFHLSPRLKQCFALCSIFPKGYEFEEDELVKLWMAHSLIEPSRSGERPEHIGRTYFERLRVLSFFQIQPDSKKYRMHDYMHELAELVSGKYSCILNDGNSELDPQTHHLSLISEKVAGKANVIYKCTRLRTFLMPHSHKLQTDFGEILSKMFRKLKYLRVLDLSSSRLSELPKTVAELKLLCYLNLSSTQIKWLPNALCSLRNLQTIKLLECPWFLILPKGLSRLIKLRHLEIDETFWKYRCSMQPPNIGRLSYLQNLHKFRVGKSRKGYGIEQLKGMNYLEGSLHIMELNNAVNAAEAKLKEKQRLRVLELEWAAERDNTPEDRDDAVLEDLEPHSSLTELRVHRYRGKRTPSWLSGGELESLKTLTLEGCHNLEALTLGRQAKLEVICIKNMQKLRELPAQLDCPSLHTLKISNCPNLIQLPESIPELQLLKVKRCSSLKVIPPLVDYGTLVLVDNPILEGFQGYDSVDFRDFGADIWRCMITNCPKIHGLPAKYYNSCSASINRKLEIGECESIYFDRSSPLTQLAIDTCHRDALLEAMNIISEHKFGVTNDSVVSFHFLQSLSISNISDLISFPTSWELNITSLYISACKDLEDLFDSRQSCNGRFPCLVNLCIRDCPKLLKFPEGGLPRKLELLVIQSCISLESLGPPDVLKDLTSLADVCIVDCPKLQSFPAQGFPSSLQHLRIQASPLVTEKVSKKEEGRGPDWPKIMNIPYLEIDELDASPAPFFASCSQSLTCFKGH